MVSSPPQLANLTGFNVFGGWPATDRVMLACSGGADSTYLAWAWQAFATSLAEPPLATAIVINHGCRPESFADAQQAAANLQQLGLEVEVRTLDSVRETENNLRISRYQAFAEFALESDSRILLTAHNADDVAETVLLRIMRGTGLRGLSGIPQQRTITLANGQLLQLRRPLLSLRSNEIRSTLSANNITWVEDLTNQDSSYARRNYLRQEILPHLEKISTGDPIKALLRLASEASDRNQSLDELLSSSIEWKSLPSYYRRQVIAQQLRQLHETVSPARLVDLEQALLKTGKVGVSVHHQLRLISSGQLESAQRN